MSRAGVWVVFLEGVLDVCAASDALAEAERLVAGFGNARAVRGDVNDLRTIAGMVEEADVVIR